MRGTLPVTEVTREELWARWQELPERQMKSFLQHRRPRRPIATLKVGSPISFFLDPARCNNRHSRLTQLSLTYALILMEN